MPDLPDLPDVRRLRADADDPTAADALGAEAFGAASFPRPAPDLADWEAPGLHRYGIDDPAGGLAAQLSVRDDASWWGGAELATAGIASVAVRPEHRGRGLLTPLFDIALREARERGAVVSTLYATAPGIYRRFGYDLVTEMDDVELSTASLARLGAPDGVALRRVGLDDPTLPELYAAWACAHNGPLTRRAPVWSDVDRFAGATAATLVTEGGPATGHLVWRRPEGYDEGGRLDVLEMVAATPDAARALWAVVGSFASVAPTARLRTSGTDALRLTVPGATWRPVARHPYSLRLLDLTAALATRAVGPVDATVPFGVDADEHVGGSWLLTAAGGRATCEPGGDSDGPVFSVAGVGLAWAGAWSCADLRAAGHLRGPTTYDAAIDALFGGWQVHVRDYF